MKIVCAWCQTDLGEKYPEQPGTSHGICPKCRDEILAETNGQQCSSFEDGAEVLPPSPMRPRPSIPKDVKCR